MRSFLQTTLLLLTAVAFLNSACSSGDSGCLVNVDCSEGEACSATGTCVMAFPLVISTDRLPDGFEGVSYEETIMEATGGLGTNTWTLSAGPSWLSLSETGMFSSTDTETIVGDYAVTVGVTDESNRGNGQLVEREYTLSIVICSGEGICWEGRNDACAVGMRACVNGEFGDCVIDENIVYSADPAHCGPDCNPCDTTIANICSAGICGCGGDAACTGDLNCCGEENAAGCEDLLVNPAHCGGCGFDCAARVLHVETPTTCVGGVCGYVGGCADGWHDCDGDRSNGCEVEQSDFHCASCDDNCTEGPNAEPGTCLEETDRCDYDCDDHYMDCDSAAWGCETDIRNPTTCGDCPGGDVDDCTLGEVDLLCLYDSVNAEYYCGCDVAANHHGNNQDNPDGNVLCGDTQICCVVDDKGTCVEHDAEHCFDCGVGTPSVCNPAVGGIYCIPAEAGGPWGCTCFEDGTSQDHESCRNYDFSVALCSQATELCICGETPNGCLTPDACCITASGLGCTDLANDKLNCGMCGVVCESESCGVVEGGGRPGACNWSDAEICPSPSGAPDRNADGYCDCNFFDAQPCPIGQYCVSNRGCCPLSDSPAEDCSIACIDAGNEWCNDGTCAAVGACPS